MATLRTWVPLSPTCRTVSAWETIWGLGFGFGGGWGWGGGGYGWGRGGYAWHGGRYAYGAGWHGDRYGWHGATSHAVYHPHGSYYRGAAHNFYDGAHAFHGVPHYGVPHYGMPRGGFGGGGRAFAPRGGFGHPAGGHGPHH